MASGSWSEDKLDRLLESTFSGFDLEVAGGDEDMPAELLDLASEYVDSHEWTGRVSTKDVIANVIDESSSQANAALKILSEKEWHINCRIIKCCASVFRDLHVSSLEKQKTPLGTLEWHASRGAGLWELSCAKIVDNMTDPAKLRYMGLTPDTAAATSRITDDTFLYALIQKRAERLFSLCICSIAQHSWTMKRMSLCPPTAAAAVMSTNPNTAKSKCDRLHHLYEGLRHAVSLIDTEEEPRKLRELLADMYFRLTPLYQELMLLMKAASWSYKDPQVREQLWDIFSGISSTKRVLEDMFGRLKTIITWQNRNKRIDLHRVAAECSVAPTLADGCCGDLWNLTDEDWATDTGVVAEDITKALFHPDDHKLEDDLQDSTQ